MWARTSVCNTPALASLPPQWHLLPACSKVVRLLVHTTQFAEQVTGRKGGICNCCSDDTGSSSIILGMYYALVRCTDAPHTTYTRWHASTWHLRSGEGEGSFAIIAWRAPARHFAIGLHRNPGIPASPGGSGTQVFLELAQDGRCVPLFLACTANDTSPLMQILFSRQRQKKVRSGFGIRRHQSGRRRRFQ